jgi:hypothetical protein
MAQNNIDTDNMINDIIESEVDCPQTSTELVPGLSAESLQEFKDQVKTWIELDIIIKRLQLAIKERKKVKDGLNEKILKFMICNNIEDLNTKSGIIRYKKTKTKAPLSQKKLKEKFHNVFESNDKLIKKIDEIFDDRDVKEKTSLKKINFSK